MDGDKKTGLLVVYKETRKKTSWDEDVKMT